MTEPLDELIEITAWDGREPLSAGLSARHVLVLMSDEDCPQRFGCRPDDFACGTALYRRPGLPLGNEESAAPIVPTFRAAGGVAKGGGDALVLSFTRELYAHTALEERLGEYTFGRYRAGEALHLSARELDVMRRDMAMVRREMGRDVDDYSRRVLTDCLQLLLDHMGRFYRRQFVTREACNETLLRRLRGFLKTYEEAGRMEREGLPTVAEAAAALGHSAAYVLDLLQHELGQTWDAYLFSYRFERAKSLLRSGVSVGDVASRLSFRNTPFFSSLFHRLTGLTPRQYARIS